MQVTKIKIAIADDHKIFRDAMIKALSRYDKLQFMWEAEDGEDMLNRTSITTPDVLLMDIRMPKIDGISAIKLLREKYEKLKIIVITMYDDGQMIYKMMELGANAYLIKTACPDEIYEAIVTCMHEDYYFNKPVNDAVLSKLMKLKHVRHSYENQKLHLAAAKY